MTDAAHILVVDDDREIRSLLRAFLEKNGLRATAVGDGAEARRALAQGHVDLVVLDLMLPGRSGLDVLAELRRADETKQVGVILLTARKEEQDRIAGLSQGADDYLAKPFSPQELVLRVGAVLRRLAAAPVAAGGILAAAGIRLDPAAHRVSVHDVEIELTATEFKLLRLLMERSGRVQARADLLETVWQAQPDIQTRTVDMHVQRLRTKLGDAGDCVETVRGVGYRFRVPPANER